MKNVLNVGSKVSSIVIQSKKMNKVIRKMDNSKRNVGPKTKIEKSTVIDLVENNALNKVVTTLTPICRNNKFFSSTRFLEDLDVYNIFLESEIEKSNKK